MQHQSRRGVAGTVRATATRAARSTVRFAAERIASSDRLMGVVEDLMNEANFAGLSQHEEMLSDKVRVDAYHRGIHHGVQPGDVVLDLGSGTGLLAFMASRAGARKVYAVEHSDFIEVAREIGRHNGFANVEFVQANSRDFTPPEPIDVVVHEQMGDELFNENMLHNLLDLRDRVLRPGGRFLPSTFRLFVEPVTFHDPFRVRRFWNIALPDGIDLTDVQHSLAATRFDTGEHEVFWARPGSVAATIGEPSPLIEFDLDSLESVSALPTEHVIERVAATDAIVDGLCVWFEAAFSPGPGVSVVAAGPGPGSGSGSGSGSGTGSGSASSRGAAPVLTTSPLAPLTSWGNRVFRMDREVVAGDTVRAVLHMPRLVDPNGWFVQS